MNPTRSRIVRTLESVYQRGNQFVLTHQLEIMVFVCAFAVRLALIAIADRENILTYDLGSDGGDYVNEAENLVQGRGFSRSYSEPYLPDAIRTPLYPLFLAGVKLVTGSYVPVIFIEAVLSSFAPVLGVCTARFFIRSSGLLLAIGLFLSIQLDYVFNTIFYGSEGLSIVLLSWALYEIVRMVKDPRPNRAGLVAGFSLGLTTLVRPITYYAPIFLLPLIFYVGYREHRLRPLLKAFGIFLATFVLVLSPWMVRNYTVFGAFGLDTVGWFNVYTRLAASVEAIDSGDDFYTSYHKLLDDLSVRGYINHPPPVSEREIEQPSQMAMLRTESLRIFSEHPHALLLFTLWAPIAVLTQDNTLGLVARVTDFRYEQPPHFSASTYAAKYGITATLSVLAPYLKTWFAFHYVMRALWAIFALLAFVGAWILWRRGEYFGALFLLGFIGYIILFSINAGMTLDARYRVQFLMFEAILVAVALERFWMKWRTKRVSL